MVVGAQSNDAFSTLVCKARPCTADDSNDITANISDSSINVLQISYNDIAPTDGNVFLAIFGFGEKKFNVFSLLVIIKLKASDRLAVTLEEVNVYSLGTCVG